MVLRALNARSRIVKARRAGPEAAGRAQLPMLDKGHLRLGLGRAVPE